VLRTAALLFVLLLAGCAGSGQAPAPTAPPDGPAPAPAPAALEAPAVRPDPRPAPEAAPGRSGSGAEVLAIPADASELVLDVPWGGAVAHARILMEGGSFPWVSFQPYAPPDGQTRTDVLAFGLVAVQATQDCPLPARAYAVRYEAGGGGWGFDTMTRHADAPMAGGLVDLLAWREASYEGKAVALEGPMRFLLRGDGEAVHVPVSVVTPSSVRFTSSAWPEAGEHRLPLEAPLALAAATFRVPWLAVGEWQASLAADAAAGPCGRRDHDGHWGVVEGSTSGVLDLGAWRASTGLTATLSHAPAAGSVPLLDPQHMVAVTAIGLDVELPAP